LLSAKQVAPGDSGQIEVTWKTESSGRATKSVEVFSNDPRQPRVVLNVTAVIEPEFVLSESFIYFGKAPGGKPLTRELLITAAPGKTTKVISAQSSDPNVEVRLEPVPGDARKTKLVALRKAAAKPGYHFGMITLKTSSTLKPELKITVRGMVAGNGVGPR
jgi:hypothetical protein